MTDRGRARHRAPSRATTPLSSFAATARTGLQHAADGGVELVSRGGAAVVLSTGLVAATALTVSALPQVGGSSPQDATLTLEPAAASLTSFERGVVNPQAVSRGGASVATGADAVKAAAESRAAAVAKERADRAAARRSAVASATAASPAQRVAQTPLSKRTATPKATTARTTAKKTTAERTTAKKAATRNSTAARTTVKKATAAKPAATTAAKTAAKQTTTTAKASSARGSSVLAIASRYVGLAYRYGGTTPSGFDCSGYTQYVFRQVGVSLPRTSQQQFAATTRITRAQARPGDLVFVGGLGHVGIYAGNNMMYDSPRTGKSVSKRAIWTSNVQFGRI